MGNRRARLRDRLRALPAGGKPAGHRQGADRVFRERLKNHSRRHRPRKRTIQYTRALAIPAATSEATGCPAFAGHDEAKKYSMPQIDRQSAFSGTKEVAEPLRFDAAALARYLAAHAPGFAGPLTVRQFKGGQSNPTYLLETPQRAYVLRRKPPGKLLPSAHAVDREFRVISALHAQGFPAAEPVLYCADADVAGTPFYLMAHVDGRVIWEPHIPDTAPAERAAIFDA